jgi:hypothetical protein
MGALRTAGVKQLIDEVLATVSRRDSEDIIDEVFRAIAAQEDWHRRYDDLCRELGKTVVNTWGGYWIARAVGRVGDHQVPASSGLTETYSKLYPAPSIGRESVKGKERVAGLHVGAMVTAQDFDAPIADEFWMGKS